MRCLFSGSPPSPPSTPNAAALRVGLYISPPDFSFIRLNNNIYLKPDECFIHNWGEFRFHDSSKFRRRLEMQNVGFTLRGVLPESDGVAAPAETLFTLGNELKKFQLCEIFLLKQNPALIQSRHAKSFVSRFNSRPDQKRARKIRKLERVATLFLGLRHDAWNAPSCFKSSLETKQPLFFRPTPSWLPSGHSTRYMLQKRLN